MTARIVVIAVGNPYRSDDGAGLQVARRVRDQLEGSIEVVEHDGDASGLLDLWEGAELAVVVDAVHSHGAEAGHIHRVEVGGHPPQVPDRRASSHGMGPGDAVALGRALGRLPRRLVLYGVEGKTFSAGVGLSVEVDTALDYLVPLVVEEVESATRAASSASRFA